MASHLDLGRLRGVEDDAPRIGTEARLVLTPRAGVFLERTMGGGAVRIAPCPDELLDLMRVCFAIPTLYILRYFASQAADFNHEDNGPKIEHIPAAYVRRFQVKMRAELLRCVGLGVCAKRDAYEFLPILQASFVRLMTLSVDYRQLPTPTGPVTLHEVGSWLHRACDVPNDQWVFFTPPLSQAAVKFVQVNALDAQAPLPR